MPNWAEGNLRIRTYEYNVARAFFCNEIEVIGNADNGGERVFKPIVQESRFGELLIVPPRPANMLHDLRYYVKNTTRNFICPKENGRIACYTEPKRDIYILIADFKAAWYAEPDPYIEKSKKYGVDIAITTYEGGMGFRQRIDIRKGKLIKNETTEFDNWLWDADFPELGG